jgi:hypothetical protein
MRLSRESFLNEIDESDLQFEKHDEQRMSTFRGIVIDSRPEYENASDSICLSRESFSNEIDESDLQFEKYDEQRISTFRDIVIDLIGMPSKAWTDVRDSQAGSQRGEEGG